MNERLPDHLNDLLKLPESETSIELVDTDEEARFELASPTPADFLDEAPVEPESEIHETVQTHIDSLEKEPQAKAFEAGIMLMRDALEGVPDYAVFGSGAMYLMSHKYKIEGWPKKPPGDIDIAVTSIESFKRIEQGLKDTPGCHFNGEGVITSSLDGAKILSGTCEVTMPGRPEPVIVPFEVFLSSTLIPERAVNQATEVEGIRSLTLDGLKESYRNIHSFESVVKESLTGRVGLLLNPEMRELFSEYLRAREAGEGSEERERFRTEVIDDDPRVTKKEFLEGLLRQTQLSIANIEDAYAILDDIERNSSNTVLAEAIEREDLANLLAHGLKQKVEKRDRNIAEMRALMAVKYADPDYKPEQAETSDQDAKKAA